MNKKMILKKLDSLVSVFNSTRGQKALEVLLEELESGNIDTALKVKVPSSESDHKSIFPLPLDVTERSNAFALYTDGACRGNPGPGAYAYMIQSHDGELVTQNAGVEKDSTNNKMEMSAIISGLEYLSAHVNPMNEVYVYTDSKYVVDGMKIWIHNWKKRGWKKADNKVPENVVLWQTLDELSKICHVHFNWIKGHAGHPQNEHVDQLANIALDENGF